MQTVGGGRMGLFGEVAVRQCVLVRIEKNFRRALDAGLRCDLTAVGGREGGPNLRQEHLAVFVCKVQQAFDGAVRVARGFQTLLHRVYILLVGLLIGEVPVPAVLRWNALDAQAPTERTRR